MRLPYCFLLLSSYCLPLALPVKAEEPKLVDLTHDPADNPRHMPLNISSPLAGSRIESSDASLSSDKLLNLVDPNRASGVELTKGKEYNFTLKFDNLEQINKMTLAGELKGSSVDIKLSKIPSSPDQTPSWEDVVVNKRLDSDINSLNFKPRPGYQASITLKTDGYEGNTPPTLRDVSAFGTKDLRAYTFASKSQAAINNSQAFAPPGSPIIQNGGNPPLMKINVSSIAAGASIVSTTMPLNARQVDNAIDDNVATFLEIPKQVKQGSLIVDLGQSRNVDHISLTHSKSSGVLKAYLVTTVPGKSQSKLGMRTFIIIAVRGRLILTRKGAQNPLIVRKGDAVLPTDVLTTGKNSYCELKCEDSSVIRLSPETSFQYTPKDRVINVNQGSMLVSTASSVEDVMIKTPTHNIKAPAGSCVLVENASSSDCKVTNLPSSNTQSVQISEQPGKTTNPPAPLSLPVSHQTVLSNMGNSPVRPESSESNKPSTFAQVDTRAQPISVQDVVRNTAFFDSDVFGPLPASREKTIQTAMSRELVGNEPMSSQAVSSSPSASIKDRLAGTSSADQSAKTRAAGIGEIPGVPVQDAMYIGSMELDKSEFSELEIPANMDGRFVILYYIGEVTLPDDLSKYEATFKIYDIDVFGSYTTEDLELSLAPPDRLKYLTASLLDTATDASKSPEDTDEIAKISKDENENPEGLVSKINNFLTPSPVPVDASPTH